MPSDGIKIDKNSPIPVYYQIETDLKKRIMRQEWEVGGRLPGEVELAEQYDVSRITLRQALAELEKDGVIRKERGKGTFIASNPTPYVNSLSYAVVSKGYLFRPSDGPAVTAQLLEKRLVTELFPSVAEHLTLSRSDSAVYIKRLYLIDGRPIAINRSYLPADLVPGMESRDMVNGSVLETIQEHYGLTADRVEDCIEGVRATPGDCALLRCFHDTPLVLVEGTSFLAGGRPMEYSNTLWSGDSVRFHLTLRNSEQGFAVWG